MQCEHFTDGGKDPQVRNVGSPEKLEKITKIDSLLGGSSRNSALLILPVRPMSDF